MNTKQYGMCEAYKPGELGKAMAALSAALEMQFPGRSARWLHIAPGDGTASDTGFISWKLCSDVPPINGEQCVSQAKPTSL